MGLTCSLLGHSYGDGEVRRDREERGDEVVVTVREVKTCTRCGEESVVTESTEVRSVEPDPRETDEEAWGEESVAAAATQGAGGGFAGVDDELDPTAAEDDAVILEDEPEAPEERRPGQWPDADDTRLDEAGEESAPADEPGTVEDATEAASADQAESADAGEILDADAEGDASGTTADAGDVDDAEDDAGADEDSEGAGDDGGEILDADAGVPDGTAAGDERAADSAPEAPSGDWPETPDSTGDANETPDSTGDANETPARMGPGDATGIESAGTVEARREAVDVDAELVCPSCGFSEAAVGSSHRAGDICPECKKGYLSQE